MNTLTGAAMRCIFAGGQPPGERELARFQRIAVLASCAILLAVLFVPDAAHAQQLEGLIQWFRTNVMRYAMSAGVLFIALTLLALRFNYVFVGCVAIGGLIAANYQQLSGLFPV